MFRFAFSLLCLCVFILMTLAAPLPSNVTDEASNSASATYTGTTTYYYTQGSEGACGGWNKNSDHIVALGPGHYQGGSHCNQYIHVENTSNGKSVVVQVRDECVSCADSNRIDLTPSAFSEIGNEVTGVLPVKWYFLPDDYKH